MHTQSFDAVFRQGCREMLSDQNWARIRVIRQAKFGADDSGLTRAVRRVYY
jgi:hypothetical protein